MKTVLTWRGLYFLFAAVPLADAGQREVVNGYVEPVIREPYDYLFRPAPFSEPRMGLNDASAGAEFTSPSRARLDVERTANFSGGLPVATILRRLPDDVLWPGTFHLSPERFAGQNTGLNPGFNESDPFSVTAPADFDSDGVPDESDTFPDDPAESTDNDRDGKGDNADPDDDNDLMPDDYEAQNKLDPFTDDSLDDPDSDGVTNVEECAAATDPHDPASFFHFESISGDRPDLLRLEWLAVPGRDYEVWHRPALDPRGERLLEGISVATPQMTAVSIPATAASDFLFLRIVLHPSP